MTFNRSITLSLLAAVTLLARCPSLIGQSALDPEWQEAASRIRDHLEVFTDRSIYIVSERILFRADVFVDGLEKDAPWSSVLYTELVTPSGGVVASSKHPVASGTATGMIDIPPGILTGNYYLKNYTRWMRNRGPVQFNYVPLRIINPFINGVAGGSQVGTGTATLVERDFNWGVLNLNNLPSLCAKGESVRVRLSVSEAGYHEPFNCSVTIVPEGAIDTVAWELISDPAAEGEFSLNYLPDLFGASLSGRVSRMDGSPASFTRIYFSRLGEDPDFMAVDADNEGRFVVTVPSGRGEQEMFVVPEPSDGQQVRVKIDQDFDRSVIRLPGEDFRLTESDRELATWMAIQVQLERAFNQKPGDGTMPSGNAGEETVPFYGTPDFRLEMDEFVQLPSLEEVFVNLVPDVNVVRRRGIRSLKVESGNTAISVYPLLIMMDFIPVFNPEMVLSLSPEKIRRIDVIHEVYVKGGASFGGLISILSRKGDMAGMDLEDQSYFFTFRSVEQPVSEPVPGHLPGDRVPDTRNTLLWIDHLVVERGRPAEIQFNAPSQPGNYVILVRGASGGDEIHAATARFRVE